MPLLRSCLLTMLLVQVSSSAAEGAGELSIPELAWYDSAQLERIRALVRDDPQAARRHAERLAEAEPWLEAEPRPLAALAYEGRLNTDPQRIACVARLQDLRGLALLLQAWAGSGESRHQLTIRRLALAWAGTYQPTGNPINENKLEPVLVALHVLLPEMPVAEAAPLRKWVRALADAEAARPTEPHNWGSKRLKLLLLCAAILDAKELRTRVLRDARGWVDAGLYADGGSEDLRRRDALSYHVSGLEPMLQLAVGLRRLDPTDDLYGYQGRQGGSIARSLAFLDPYVRREKIYEQWRNTTARLDRERAAAGIPEYQPGYPYDPVRAASTLVWEAPFRPERTAEVAVLLGSADQGFPTWTAVELAALTRTE